ncbi:hypothetical protein VOLCADRAFT_100252 [Volvox carteri f. nagariensis]|uniref:Uncharacterized protein n=1 Tax=Volvox carteri f. nagariensis TaxID=3068 RepID=D8UJU1_VOLCA|nr:uncharacterized protein VOLCADRAFT_100252 [Volvox carteri f. nagariensis]EFJ40000.1 hypothetical protein VOLCADRAFT_100252 [Volvox carteri f. nagariensis]|eukprot:XP_002958920.1 hypothetical protein VOLCADRAFT_100252 [Volvox carteri f. nagariensis]
MGYPSSTPGSPSVTPLNLVVATPKEVSQLVEYHIREGVPLLTRMVVTGAVLTFCGLLCFDDLSHVLVHTDLLHIYGDRVEIFLFKSKTDQHCKGAFVTISRIGGPCCPVLPFGAAADTTHVEEVVAALPSTVEAMPFHKFRDMLWTLCTEAGVQKLGRWKSNTVFEFAYVREDGAWRRAVTAHIPLGYIPRNT